MPEVAFMKIDGIDGESNVKNQKNMVEVLGFSHEVSKEVDPLDCRQVRSDRRHRQFEVVKRFDKATPLSAQAVCQGKKINQVEIKWYRQPADGGSDPEHYFTHTFKDVIITSIRHWMPNVLDGSKKELGHMETVSFGYGQLTWKSETGGTEFQDDVRGKMS